ncbi:hypothetical protein, partial [Mesorhizobium sp. M2D.F.Ca.ET.171.01.1.1]|uniref:hypothetical protein n=1 Tax=Mesorhizobium sp. M2D.F.Ca.ET.171.01.1.1 TaxID=2563936 RepID=UPI001AEEB9BE
IGGAFAGLILEGAHDRSGATDQRRDGRERNNAGGYTGVRVQRGLHAAPWRNSANAAFFRAPLCPAGHLPL